MAATDKPFNNQRTLDIVFAVSNILMLLSIIWMLWQDHFREYKVEQRLFREIEVAMAQRSALDLIPKKVDFDAAKGALEKALGIRDTDTNKAVLRDARAALAGLQPLKERAEAKYQAAKADVESISSFLNIALEERRDEDAKKLRADLKKLNDTLDARQAERDDIGNKMKAEQNRIEALEAPVTKAIAAFKKVNDKLDAQVKLALTKRWGWGDWFRTQPVINGFADPLKIHQFVIKDITIDYNFAQVPRYDRCMTCHMAIDRPTYTPDKLRELTEDAANSSKLDDAKELYKARIETAKEAFKDDPKGLANFIATTPNPHSINLIKLTDKQLTPARIKQFSAHPRLDLFVGANSKHSAERFGCSACHAGQGSGTSFIDASHNPNTMASRKDWEKDRHWEHNHMWDFPMLPTRFIESSCIKCHHEVTDLISTDNRNEAPKVLRGYGLIKENGCFGCHEISGWKSGNRIGPDLRLEPSPALDDHALVTPTERDRAEKDTDNRPGNMRKVGPSLARLTEKTNLNWVEKWIRNPSAFRPDTKMPHYYGLSTNDEKYLKEEHDKLIEAAKAAGKEVDITSQEKFPNTEIASIAHFLMKTSKNYVGRADELRTLDSLSPEERKKKSDVPPTPADDEARRQMLVGKGSLTEAEAKEFGKLKERLRLRKEVKLVDLAPKHAGDPKMGRVLFTEKGCLSCHTHKGTETAQGGAKEFVSPAVKSDAEFGPNLTQLVGKFGTAKEDRDAARVWLIQWITNPHVHSPRSRMPVTHLEPAQAADVAAWLLSQESTDHGEDWDKIKVTPPARKDMEDLAKVYLTRMMSKSDMDRFVKGDLKKEDFEVIKKDLTQDEQDLYKVVKDDSELKYYLGKKAVTRLGCFGCHDIPGFESTKSIGVGLNDWGKKPADRLAFEDIGNFYKTKYYHDVEVDGKKKSIDGLVDDNGKPYPIIEKDGKKFEPYEHFYAEALLGHHRQREGYLNQKLRDPRSYDFNRVRTWDDRARMPEFHFARPRMKDGEKKDDYKARILKDEAEAREAVATFVLGLTAEQVPAKSVNQPVGDRMAEVKGRQVLEKYNCNSCHSIRPGVYEFKPGPEALKELVRIHADIDEAITKGGEIVMSNHINWVGRNPVGAGTLTAFGSSPRVDKGFLQIRLSEALRFEDKEKNVKNIAAGVPFFIPLADMQPGGKGIKTQEEFERRYGAVQPFGGAFTELLTPYLNAKDPGVYTETGDAARGSLPPSLIGQGERTQADWLVKFLLNPQPIRRMAILRMPKFNMSPQEAEILANYFAAVSRQTNPGIGLVPHEAPPSREDFDGPYWSSKTAAYVERLKKTKEKDADGKETARTLYQVRLDSYKRVWEQEKTEGEAALNKKLKELEQNVASLKMRIEAKQKELKDAKDDTKAVLTKELETLQSTLTAAPDQEKALKAAFADLAVEEQQKIWEKRDAYLADAYRLVMVRDNCTKCHQLGSTLAGEKVKQGPPLDRVYDRLRGDWIVRWVDQPARMAPHGLMPPYFPTHSKNKLQYQTPFAGEALEQMEAVRDVLLNYPRIEKLPINRGFNPDRPADK